MRLWDTRGNPFVADAAVGVRNWASLNKKWVTSKYLASVIPVWE